jgi:hypothetical protein
MCYTCKEVIAYTAPGTDPDDGFKRIPGETYHIADCPKCNPDKFKGDNVLTVFAEKQAYHLAVTGKHYLT